MKQHTATLSAFQNSVIWSCVGVSNKNMINYIISLVVTNYLRINVANKHFPRSAPLKCAKAHPGIMMKRLSCGKQVIMN